MSMKIKLSYKPLWLGLGAAAVVAAAALAVHAADDKKPAAADAARDKCRPRVR